MIEACGNLIHMVKVKRPRRGRLGQSHAYRSLGMVTGAVRRFITLCPVGGSGFSCEGRRTLARGALEWSRDRASPSFLPLSGNAGCGTGR